MIDEKRAAEVEKAYKDLIFRGIDELSSAQTELINQISANAKNIGQSNFDIYNIGITLNNKLVELYHIFKKAGISIFISKLEAYDLVTESFIGKAIIEDLIECVNQASETLNRHSLTIKNISNRKIEQLKALRNINSIQKFFAKIKSFFIPTKPIDLSLTEQEQDMLDGFIQEYRDIDNKIWKYNLEDNIIPAIVKDIKQQKYGAYAVPGLLEESVIPDLRKLGLEKLVPQLQNKLIEEYKKDLPKSKIYEISEERMYLYVPDFSKRGQTDNGGDLNQRIDIRLVNRSKEKISEQVRDNRDNESER